MREWFERESFWRDLYPFMFPPNRFAAAPAEVEQIMALTGFKGRDVLDLCSGPGRHSVELARRGLRVTGVDRSPFLMRKAAARAKAAQVTVEWVHEDMREFVRPDSFDLILSMFTSFGYFDNQDEDRRVLANMFRNLRAGGACLIDVMGKERLASILLTTHCDELPDGTLVVQRHEVFDDWSRMRNEWILIKGTKVKRFKFHHTIYSGQELKDRLLTAGFAEVWLYGSLAGVAYGPGAPRLVAVARKA